MASDPYRNLFDPSNERALVYLAIENFDLYQRLGLEPDDFHRPLYATLVTIAALAYEAHGQTTPGVQLDRVLTMASEKRVVSDTDRQEALAELLDRPLGIMPDGEKLKRLRRLRDLRRAFLQAALALEEGDDGLALSTVERAREEADRRLREAVAAQDAHDFVHDWLSEVTMNQDSGISLGLPRLKTAIGSISPGSVLVVGAGTSVGKSSFAIEMMLKAADDGTCAGLISTEDPKMITVSRIVSAFCPGVSARALMRGDEPERRHDAVLKVVEYGNRILLSECVGGTEQHVMARMSAMQQRGARLVIVDYIGEVYASTPQQDRRNEVRWVLGRLKAHASRIGVALVVCSQLTRPKDHSTSHEPTKHDLKEAGDLENAAEYIVLLWREKEHDFAPVHVKLAKSKMGGTGARWLMQREIDREGPRGERLPGSARLREVVKDRAHPSNYDFPLVVEDFEARIVAALTR